VTKTSQRVERPDLAAGSVDLPARPWATAVLREAGLKVTRPRVLVLTALRGRERPVTARDVYDALATLANTTSLRETPPGVTTIYRALTALAERGLLHRFPQGRAVTAYRLCPPSQHHHLVCRNCGRVQEQPPGPVPEWIATVASAEGFAIEDYHAELVGLCVRCRPGAIG
jgi:Fur family transcriptional regulator, ferric uptake regulator